MDDDRTIYTILDEHKENTTITLEKFVADILQQNLPDVHAWVQATYSNVAQKRPDLGRRQKGDLVRSLSMREAVKYLVGPAKFTRALRQAGNSDCLN